eukprot:841833_1
MSILLTKGQQNKMPSLIYTLDDMDSNATKLLILICAGFFALSILVWSCYCIARIGIYKHTDTDALGGKNKSIDYMMDTLDLELSSSEESVSIKSPESINNQQIKP